jgi:transposase
LKAVYVPYEEQEADRHLVRQRKKIWRDLVRCKNRLKGFLDYTGTEVPAQFDKANWSRNFINWLSNIEFAHSSNRITLNYLITEMELLRKELLSISNAVRKLMRSKKYNRLYYLLSRIRYVWLSGEPYQPGVVK